MVPPAPPHRCTVRGVAGHEEGQSVEGPALCPDSWPLLLFPLSRGSGPAVSAAQVHSSDRRPLPPHHPWTQEDMWPRPGPPQQGRLQTLGERLPRARWGEDTMGTAQPQAE